MSKMDFTPLYELGRELSSSASLRAEFMKDPFVLVERFGFKLPEELKNEGFHFHWIDINNNYYPAECSAVEQLLKNKGNEFWNRVEIRFGTAPGCLAFCGVCT